MVSSIDSITPVDHKILLSTYDDFAGHYYRLKALLDRNTYTSFNALYKDFSFGINFSSQTKKAFQTTLIEKEFGRVVWRNNILDINLYLSTQKIASEGQKENEETHKIRVAKGINRTVPKRGGTPVTARVHRKK